MEYWLSGFSKISNPLPRVIFQPLFA